MLGALDSQDRFDAVVPVPLHRSRLRRRGFNRAELLAQGVASELKAPVSIQYKSCTRRGIR
jgi:predicted amidophosphoribosyltransferase